MTPTPKLFWAVWCEKGDEKGWARWDALAGWYCSRVYAPGLLASRHNARWCAKFPFIGYRTRVVKLEVRL